MWEFLVAALLTLCMVMGLLLRYAPFASVATAAQKRMAAALYTALSLVTMAVLMAALYIWGMNAAFMFLRYGSVLYSLGMMIVNIFVIPNRDREHLFVFGVVITFHFLLLTVPNYVITLLPGYSTRVYLLVVLVLYSLLLAATYFPLRGLLCSTMEPLLHLEGGEYWNTVCLIPVIFFGTKFLALGGEHDSGSIQQLLSSALYVSVIVLICTSIRADHKRIHAHRMLERQLDGQRVHYAELRARVEETRKTNHDFKHHLAVIHHYIDIDDKEGLRGYCNELAGRTGSQDRIPYTGNGAADGVFYYYMQRARELGIRFQNTGIIRSHGIADADLCVLLGNALDNALTACKSLPGERSITVVCQSEKRLLSLVIRNTFDGHVTRSGDKLLSSKRKGRPGVGLSSMRSICEQYGGSMDVQWDEAYFTVMFILPLSETE